MTWAIQELYQTYLLLVDPLTLDLSQASPKKNSQVRVFQLTLQTSHGRFQQAC